MRRFARCIKGPFVDGKIATVADCRLLDVFDPATEEVIAQIPECNEVTVDAAVRSAHDAFEDGRWSGLRPADRERILLKFADLVEANGEELALLESWNQGKSINIARAVDVGASIEFMRYVAGLSTKITGLSLDVSMMLPPGAKHTAYTRREPVGVVAAIAPWNFPMMIGIWKIMPALAAGCTLVLKPAAVTPLTSFRLAELAVEAGVPPGVFNVIHGRGSIAGTALATHPLVRKISFTGSTEVGKEIARIAVNSLKRVTLELGGKNPAIVLRDADLSKTVPGLLTGALLNSGQVCAAVSRIYCERPLYNDLVGALTDSTRSMSFGAGLDPQAQVNPLVSAAHRDSVKAHIEDARRHDAKVLPGAEPPARGFYVSPTIVLAEAKHPIMQTEVFGPVVSVTPVDTAEEAVSAANDTAYGLAASIWTNNLSEAMRLIPLVKAGTVWVNNHVPVDPNLPFGGFKESGIGRDFGPNALDAYTEVKSVCITH